jgi:hypothetical protein
VKATGKCDPGGLLHATSPGNPLQEGGGINFVMVPTTVRRYAVAGPRAVMRTAGLAFNLVCLPVVLVAILAIRLTGECPRRRCQE